MTTNQHGDGTDPEEPKILVVFSEEPREAIVSSATIANQTIVRNLLMFDWMSVDEQVQASYMEHKKVDSPDAITHEFHQMLSRWSEELQARQNSWQGKIAQMKDCETCDQKELVCGCPG